MLDAGRRYFTLFILKIDAGIGFHIFFIIVGYGIIARRAYCVETFSKSMCVRAFVRPSVRPSRSSDQTQFSDKKWVIAIGAEIEYSKN